MTKTLLAAAAAAFLAAACIPAADDGVVGKVSPTVAPFSGTTVKTKLPKAEPGAIPSEIHISSSVGEVIFRHQAHISDRGIACSECHHQINAKELATPHPNYLQSSWINCKTCHNESGKGEQVYTCSGCHGINPQNIADETLSAKVVIHQQCWKCHPVNTGNDASVSCQKCHAGKEKP